MNISNIIIFKIHLYKPVFRQMWSARQEIV